MVVENSGLLTVAALNHLDCKDKKVVSVLSGGNMDVITISSVVQHGLIQRDRIFTVSVLLPDKPGELVSVASIIAEERGNVIKLDHNQFVSTNRSSAVELKITIEAFGTEHKNQIVQALEERGYRPRVIRVNMQLLNLEQTIENRQSNKRFQRLGAERSELFSFGESESSVTILGVDEKM